MIQHLLYTKTNILEAVSQVKLGQSTAS